jgi:glycosyltransferase involved in cell wall biosynthesis
MITIGIPTFNRSAFLKCSLESAIAQSTPDCRIVVLDNASTDDTREVVEAFINQHGNRIHYQVNSTNIGSTPNFNRLAELCDTEYFCWLQDDDCLHQDFAKRALNAFNSSRQIKVYSAFALVSEGIMSHYKPLIYGPPFPVNFLDSSGVQSFDGKLVAPFSLFMSVTFPPIAAFRTDSLKAYLNSPVGMTPLFAERSWTMHTAVGGTIAIDPFIGAIFRSHPGQSQFAIMHQENSQWLTFATDVDRLVGSWDKSWIDLFASTLAMTEPAHRKKWLEISASWPDSLAVCRIVKEVLTASFPPETAKTNGASLKSVVRDLVPPLAWRSIGRIARHLKSGR